jgi:zinc transporter, ZIP family
MSAADDREPIADGPRAPGGRVPAWALGLIPLALIVIALAALLSVGGDTLGDRRGPPVEELAVERTVLKPGRIELTVRNTGPDAVRVAQLIVNDAYVDYTASGNEIGRNATQRFTADYPWQ